MDIREYIKLFYKRYDIELTDQQASTIAQIDYDYASIGFPGFADSLAAVIGSLSKEQLEQAKAIEAMYGH